MKTKRKKSKVTWPLELTWYGSYIDDARDLERHLAAKPRSLQIELIGTGTIPSDIALLMRSMLLDRSPKIRLITNARSSLHGSAVLIWLLGDQRLMRADARFHLRPAGPYCVDSTKAAGWRDRIFDENHSEEDDYVRVLDAINEFLPVKELAGQPIELSALKQFGLTDNVKVDHFLAESFRREEKIDAKNSPSRKSNKEIKR